MKQISLGKLIGFYIETLSQCSTKILKEPDELVECLILEEFIIGATSFLHHTALDKLFENGIIDEIIVEKSKELRTLILAIDGTDLWNIESIRNSDEWRKIITLSDEIKELISLRWTYEELQNLYNL